jgi:hypothetical protein
MKASEARQLSADFTGSHELIGLRNFVDEKIKEAAQNGDTRIIHPLQGLAKWPAVNQQEALWFSLRADGFNVQHHPDPDPGNPVSRPYTAVSW